MINHKPRLSIGLPVFNGDEYLEETLDTILAQTYTDFELIISDNASTDKTEEICKGYEARDGRVRYLRNDTNLGAVPNFNRVFELSTGEYFKWAAHDDLCTPDYLEHCVEVLDNEPSAVISHPKTRIIDRHGNHVRDYDDYLDFRSPRPHERFRDYLFRPSRMCNAILGVIRARELRKTPLLGSYIASDRVLLGELVLRGGIHQVPKRLFFRRRHPRLSWLANPTRSAYANWVDKANRGKVQLPKTWKQFLEYLKAIKHVRLNMYEKTRCYMYLTVWFSRTQVRTVRGYWRSNGAERSNSSIPMDMKES